MSQYSAVDLGCILGTQRKDIRKALKEEIVDSNTLNQDDQAQKEEAAAEREKKKNDSAESSSDDDKDKLDANGKLKSNFQTLNRGSMNDYFEQKMAAMKLRLAGNVATPEVKVEEEEPVPDIKTEKERKKKGKRKSAAAEHEQETGNTNFN